MISITVNGKPHDLDADPQMPLLWVLREPLRACVTPLAAVAGKAITTIEGLSTDNSHPVQQAWIVENPDELPNRLIEL